MTVAHTRAHLHHYHVDLTMWNAKQVAPKELSEIIERFEESKNRRRRFYDKRYLPDGIVLITHDEPITPQLHCDAIWLFQELLDIAEYERQKRFKSKRRQRHNDTLGGER